MRPERIISGGQTGADTAALIVARELGIATGGTAPKSWRTEDGPAPWLADYGLVESPYEGYMHRTGWNIKVASGTAIFGDLASAGSRLTTYFCRRLDRAYLVNPTGAELREWCEANNVRVLNVAGNRASRNPGVAEQVRRVLTEAFGPTQEEA